MKNPVGRTGRAVAGLAAMSLGVGQAGALVINVLDPAAQAVASGDFQEAFGHVGTRGVGGAVYLGNGWVLTANHVGAGSVNFGGTTYNAIAGTSHQLVDPNDPGNPPQGVDLRLFQIAGNPTLPVLPGVTISPNAVSAGDAVRLVGAGRTQSERTYWSLSGPYDNLTWTEVALGDSSVRLHETSDTRQVRWGDNLVHAVGVTVSSDNPAVAATRLFTTMFTEPNSDGSPAVPFEAQAVNNDSGGGVFTFNPDTAEWQLSGIMVSVGLFSNQPGGTNSAAFSGPVGNVTYIADLSVYADQIAALVPEPAGAAALLLGLPLALRRRRLSR